MLSSNIFNVVAAEGASYSTFNNNITHNTVVDDPWNKNNNAYAGWRNKAEQDPQMVDQASVDAGTNDPLLNFTVKAGSPAKGAAADGLDMGLLFDPGGVLNWNRCRASNFPFVNQLIITNQTIYTNSFIKINAQAKSN